MAESTSPGVGGGQPATDPYRSSGRRGLQEVYSAAVEIVYFERMLSEARTASEYYREYKHLVLLLCRFASAIRPLSTQSVSWETDSLVLKQVKEAVRADFVPPKPTIRTEVHAHSEPILIDLYVADFPMVTATERGLNVMLAELKESFVARETERGIARMGAAYLFVGELLAKYGIWNIDTKFRTTAEGWDPERRKRVIAGERELISSEATAEPASRRPAPTDDVDDDTP